MKVLYLYFVGINQVGILKKINYQIKSLKKIDCEVKVLENKNGKIYLGKTLLYLEKNNFLRQLEKIKMYLKLSFIKSIDSYEVVYLRYFLVNPFSLYFIIKLNKIKKLKICIEIPTYPYDKEVRENKISNILDRYYRKKLYKYIDRIVTYSEDKEIWGIPCINISNGIDLEEVKIVDKKNKNKNKIVFTSVSNCSFWHGIDRLLYSLEEYGNLKDKKNIQLNIVGEGSETNKLKEIVSKSEYLSKVVFFQGFKTGKDLDDIYDETDIGIGSLARHRSGLETMRALKNREYCAKGLPMIFSEDDPDLRDVPFVYHISADEQLIDIESVIKWYENMDLEPEEIREYSKQFSWDIQMKKVIDEIEKI